MHAERERSKLAIRDASDRAARDAARRTRDELTRMIPRDDDQTVYPMGKLTTPILFVHARFDLRHELFEPKDFYSRAESLRYAKRERFTLRAVQHALVLPDGTKVVWWGWEMAR